MDIQETIFQLEGILFCGALPIPPAAFGWQCHGLTRGLSDPTRSQKRAFENVTSISSRQQSTSYKESHALQLNYKWGLVFFARYKSQAFSILLEYQFYFPGVQYPVPRGVPGDARVLRRLLQHCITAITYPLHILFQTSGNVFTKTIWNLGLKPKLAVKANRVASKRTYFYFAQTSMLFLGYNKGKYSSYQSSVYLTSFLWQS